MKKISIISVLFLSLCVGFMSCQGGKGPKDVVLKTDIDSLSYAVGAQNAEQIKAVFPREKGLDLENMDDFVKGFLDEMYVKKSTYNKNYELGRGLAVDLRTRMDEQFLEDDPDSRVNKDAFVEGMIQTLYDRAEGKMTLDESRVYVQEFLERAVRRANASAIESEEQFFAENKLGAGVIETESGLQYRIITQGTGEIPGENMTVRMHYTGMFLDGTVFDSSIDREPFEFNTSGSVIAAWREAAQMMPVGSKWVIYVPSELGYGSRGFGRAIPPFSTLIFEMELLEIKK